jgi:hypothetical protein
MSFAFGNNSTMMCPFLDRSQQKPNKSVDEQPARDDAASAASGAGASAGVSSYNSNNSNKFRNERIGEMVKRSNDSFGAVTTSAWRMRCTR